MATQVDYQFSFEFLFRYESVYSVNKKVTSSQVLGRLRFRSKPITIQTNDHSRI